MNRDRLLFTLNYITSDNKLYNSVKYVMNEHIIDITKRVNKRVKCLIKKTKKKELYTENYLYEIHDARTDKINIIETTLNQIIRNRKQIQLDTNISIKKRSVFDTFVININNKKIDEKLKLKLKKYIKNLPLCKVLYFNGIQKFERIEVRKENDEIVFDSDNVILEDLKVNDIYLFL